MLGETTDLLRERYGGDLRRLRDEATRDRLAAALVRSGLANDTGDIVSEARAQA